MRDFHLPGRSPVYATNGMVATSHPLAAVEAVQALRDGGNAVDAAIAGAVLLGLCEPQMTGIGGDMFALVKPAGSNEVIALNASGRAPAATDPDALRAEGLNKIAPGHPASVTIPGAIDGFCKLSERFGRLGLERCFAPSIRYFETGVPIAPRVAADIAQTPETFNNAAIRHYTKDGRAYGTGDIFALPAQAELLKRIAIEGRDAFYTGEAADDMLAALRAAGGVHTAEDFAATEATWGTPISAAYRGRDILEHPPNGQGAIALLIARILAEFDLGSLDPNGVQRLHLEAEATKLAYDARNRFLADPEHMTALDRLTAPETARKLADLIDPARAIAKVAPLTEAVHRDTILITAIDRDGMAISLIYSIFATFGAGLASDRFGILLHNRGSGFNVTPGHPNEAGPNKRPMHTIIPGMSGRSGRIDMAFGVMGGQYQACGHAHLISNMVDFGMDPQEAIDAPRAFADPISGKLQIERGVSDGVRAGLAEMGHPVSDPPSAIGGAQAILIDHTRGVLIGGSDPRKDGCALGY
ncbi:gamma-glutamyltransferase [Alphaproteobacteria bacterium GH1-50]|uniref:Gamma-glutamyltransferase n=1 Tax=Kangsaoukella pontilimi TaxID=2691042 RepID=A0A7C9MRP7_9RHOB|nr:gamma-glutamyltransferase family protein [Kangsaoukella pontilimi]MXQ08517.1 gamma-glutamyltransferase [Kangsaoukella pontilimi]